MQVREPVKRFVIENFLFGRQNGLEDDDSFLGKGIIDSTGVLELVSFLEETYGIKVEDEDLTTDNLDSIRDISAYLTRKLPAPAAGNFSTTPETLAGESV